jgi:CheY-like chemotaxis protein
MSVVKILVVDDEVLVARDLKQRLEALGYEVPAFAISGEEAVKIADQIEPNLIFMDVRLGGSMDGIEAARLIRKQRDIPVIYLTAYSDQATLDRAKPTHPYGYVIKPFQDKNLKITIETALFKHKEDQVIMLTQKLETLEFLVSRIAHELNNSLTGVMLYLSLAKNKTNPQNDNIKFLSFAEKSCKSAINISQQLSPFTKEEAPIKEYLRKPKQKPIRILLMDDDDAIRELASRLFSRLGHSIDCINNGETAIEYYENKLHSENPYQVVILDLTIPGKMGGIEVARQLLKIDNKAKIVVSSGYSNDPITESYKRYGFSAVLPKPYDSQAASLVLNKLFNDSYLED